MLEALSVNVAQCNGAFLVTVAGEVDFATAGQLENALSEIDRCLLTVDLAEVTFIDSAGLGTLAHAHQRMERGGGTLQMVGASTALVRLFEITGLDAVFLADESGSTL